MCTGSPAKFRGARALGGPAGLAALSLLAVLAPSTPPLAAQECPPAEPDQAVIVSLVKGLDVLPSTDEVTVVPLAAFEGRPAGACDVLNVGDELRGSGGDVVVQVRCPRGSTMTLSGRFRVALAPPQAGQDCRIDLSSGTALSTSDEPTGIQAGPVSAGALQTQYEVTVQRREAQAVPDVRVFDGQVEVRSQGKPGQLSLPAGSRLWCEGSSWQPQKIGPEDVRSAADALARVSAGKAAKTTGTQPRELYTRFASLFAKTLLEPNDAAARVALADAQLASKLPEEALYQLARAGAAPTATAELAVRIPLAQAKAYEQLGKPDMARSYHDRAVRINPELVREIEGDRVMVPHPMQKPGPPRETIRPGRSLRLNVSTEVKGAAAFLSVRVTDGEGNPVAGARVDIVAGGGTFSGTRGSRVTGVTDEQGAYKTGWQCRQCAPAYTFDVTASLLGYVSATARPVVKPHV
jgi:hypothetical protein